MKLGEALILRANSQKRIEQLRERLKRNAQVQEGEKPAESPKDLLKELESTAKELTQLIQRINKTNTATELEKGLTISDALAVRDVLILRFGIYKSLVEHATVSAGRYSRSEIKSKSTVDVAEIQKKTDELAKAHRELDTKIQQANWGTELLN